MKVNTPRGESLRVLRLIRLLAEKPYTLRELADELGVHIRTVRRDLKVLELAGVEVDSTPAATDDGLKHFLKPTDSATVRAAQSLQGKAKR